MKTYLVEYTEDNGATIKTMFVSAADYTKAYISACIALPIETIIVSVTVI